MTGYWYHEGQVHELPFNSTINLVSPQITIPINSQVWIPRMQSQWYQVNARSRLVPVPIGVCRELWASLLLMGVALPQ